ELPVLGQEMVLAQEHPLVPVDFTSRHGLRNPPRSPGPITLEWTLRSVPARAARYRIRVSARTDHNTNLRAIRQYRAGHRPKKAFGARQFHPPSARDFLRPASRR